MSSVGSRTDLSETDAVYRSWSPVGFGSYGRTKDKIGVSKLPVKFGKLVLRVDGEKVRAAVGVSIPSWVFCPL